ncbi:MAG: hypothetical protein ACYCST_18540, partial [Acidimicrobiales bacterium]
TTRRWSSFRCGSTVVKNRASSSRLASTRPSYYARTNIRGTLIDKKKDRRIRPSVVVATLSAAQQREPKFKHESFIESLALAYDFVIASKSMRPGAAAKLVDVYNVLTIMPGSAREYMRPEFARDIYLLDQSGHVTTKKGRKMSLPASALTRSGGVLRTVTRNGQAKDYAGISFEEPGA